LALGCLSDARILAETGSRNAAYLTEQALEHLIRAIATSEGLHIQRSDAHLLDKTLRRIPSEQPLLARMNELSWLEAFATSYRYPTPAGRIAQTLESSKVLKSVEQLEGLVYEASSSFAVDLTDPEQPAGNAHAIR
jgi:HEPN domain-containing protein